MSRAVCGLIRLQLEVLKTHTHRCVLVCTGVIKHSVSSPGGGLCTKEGEIGSALRTSGCERPEIQSRLSCLPNVQVQCKAVVCPTTFKTQNYCDMLREICPEISTSNESVIKSSRCVTAPSLSPVWWCLGYVRRNHPSFLIRSDNN